MDKLLRGWQALRARKRTLNLRIPATVQLPEPLHASLVKEAARRNLGLSALVCLILQKVVQDNLFEAVIDGDDIPTSVA